MADNVKVLIGERNGVELEFKEEYELIAENVPFDNTGTDFTATDVQNALEEAGGAAAPPFTFGRSGNVSNNTWLQIVGQVPSNRTGLLIPSGINKISTIYASNQNVDSYTISFYEHEGNSANLTLLTSVSVTAATGNTVSVDIAVTPGRQLAAQVTAGNARNISAGAILKGSA